MSIFAALVDFGPTAYLKLLFCWLEANYVVEQGSRSKLQQRERTVRRDFWTALKEFAGRLPFVEDLVAAYYCALDPATPMRVRGILLAALAYFIFRWRY